MILFRRKGWQDGAPADRSKISNTLDGSSRRKVYEGSRRHQSMDRGHRPVRRRGVREHSRKTSVSIRGTFCKGVYKLTHLVRRSSRSYPLLREKEWIDRQPRPWVGRLKELGDENERFSEQKKSRIKRIIEEGPHEGMEYSGGGDSTHCTVR